MNKKKNILLNIGIISCILLIYMTVQGAAFTAAGAHKKQELTINYGPSETVAVIDQGKYKFFLGKFNEYYSCDTVKRGFLGLWYVNTRGTGWGEKMEQEKDVHYNISGMENYQDELYLLKVYGVISNENIKYIEIEIFIGDAEGKFDTKKVVIDKIYDDMFLGLLEVKNMETYYSKRIAAYDQKGGRLLFEEMDPNAPIIEELGK